MSSHSISGLPDTTGIESAMSTLALTVSENDRNNFTLFVNLPLELRLTIWRKTFPDGRLVDIAEWEGPPGQQNATQLVFTIYANQHFPLPIALRIHCESREETLKHYHILTRTTSSGLRIAPFVFNPAADFPVVGYSTFFNSTRTKTWDQAIWLPQLPVQSASKCVSRVKHLFVWNASFSPGKQRFISNNHDAAGGFTHGDGPYCCIFRYLPSLEVVTFISQRRENSQLHTKELRKAFAELMEGVLKGHKNVFTSGILPEIQIALESKGVVYPESGVRKDVDCSTCSLPFDFGGWV
ncbi:hypothetical protein DL98DRAFT_588787 [Cadophora sp. DSE1049]|nr:hypothetical protein DL98DRAFT_588787 [Cadophora sp. DSE1049]